MFSLVGNRILDVVIVFFTVFIIVELIVRIVKKRLKAHGVKLV